MPIVENKPITSCVIMPNTIMPSVIMQSEIMLSVMVLVSGYNHQLTALLSWDG